jgi:hypothetical protein
MAQTTFTLEECMSFSRKSDVLCQFAWILFVLLLALSAQAQITQIDDSSSTPLPGAGHDYMHMLSETVNPANGSVSMRIQVPVPKGRGLTVPFSFDYDTNGISSILAAPYGPGLPSNLPYAAGMTYSSFLFQ